MSSVNLTQQDRGHLIFKSVRIRAGNIPCLVQIFVQNVYLGTQIFVQTLSHQQPRHYAPPHVIFRVYPLVLDVTRFTYTFFILTVLYIYPPTYIVHEPAGDKIVGTWFLGS